MPTMPTNVYFWNYLMEMPKLEYTGVIQENLMVDLSAPRFLRHLRHFL